MHAIDMTEITRGLVRYNEPMAKHTSWRAGGAARCFFEPADLDDLAVFMAQLSDREPRLFIGLGSNLLVRDGGYPGTVIMVTPGLGEWSVIGGEVLRAQAGVTCAKVARNSVRRGLVGAEFFAGIPGTVGGALAMNAGAFGSETWELVEAVTTIDRAGGLHARLPGDFRVGYRQVECPAGEWFVAADFRLHGGDGEAAAERIRELLERRNRQQPTGLASCGSVFRNPAGEHAARLIEACGLKGLSVGGAQVSDQHANFIINNGAASAEDIETLIGRVAETVERECGIRLAPEVRIVGER